jgi:hypothetical protein
MKQIILTGLMALAVMQVHAQDFKAVLEKTFTAFDTATDQNVRVEQSNKLTLIAKKWENEWITHYYVSLSRALLSFDEKDADKRDAYLDEADKEKDNAVSILKKDNDETFVLAALIANARLAVNPS